MNSHSSFSAGDMDILWMIQFKPQLNESAGLEFDFFVKNPDPSQKSLVKAFGSREKLFLNFLNSLKDTCETLKKDCERLLENEPLPQHDPNQMEGRLNQILDTLKDFYNQLGEFDSKDPPSSLS